MACTDFLQPYIDWINQGDGRYVHVYGVANRSDVPSCYYFEGWLRSYNGSQMIGDAKQYFNDRVLQRAPLPFQPFSADAADSLGLALSPNGPFIHILHSWGDGQIPYAIECRDGFLFGTSSTTVLVMSFAMEKQITKNDKDSKDHKDHKDNKDNLKDKERKENAKEKEFEQLADAGGGNGGGLAVEHIDISDQPHATGQAFIHSEERPAVGRHVLQQADQV